MKLARSHLAVPASSWRMVEKATTLDADLAFLDLEDAVAPEQKADARGAVVRAFSTLDWQGKPRAFRMNALDTPWFYRDLIDVCEQASGAVDLVIIPKVHRPEDVYVVVTILQQIEQAMGCDSPTKVHAQIESAEGLLNAQHIATASPRVEALVLGPGDLAASLGMPVDAIGGRDEWDAAYGADRWHHVMQTVLVAARAAGVLAIDGPLADYRDVSTLEAAARRARALGYDGKWCIHPTQIDTVNSVFTPTEREVAWARKVIDALELANTSGAGAATIDGTMVDGASIRIARRLLGE